MPAELADRADGRYDNGKAVPPACVHRSRPGAGAYVLISLRRRRGDRGLVPPSHEKQPAALRGVPRFEDHEVDAMKYLLRPAP